ncbi:MAG: hypothetical protein NC301_09315 [Bacteroides sp.]|nr:hypothetical protein [Alistipes timonensis]MCM1311200.1 hypothetical protein [Bacteroides sp.]MCM1406514.1 hypothetical protein [[Clostridium] fimetarium]
MKFGFRKPSLKRSIAAMTTAPIKRSILREIIPGYGKRGMGWANPKKATYNHLYNMTNIAPCDLIKSPRTTKSYPREKHLSQREYELRSHSLGTYQNGIEQCKIIIALFGMANGAISDTTHAFKAVNRLFSYTSGYLNKPMNCGFDYCNMCQERLDKVHRINPTTKDICLNIVHRLKRGEGADEIFQMLLRLI